MHETWRQLANVVWGTFIIIAGQLHSDWVSQSVCQLVSQLLSLYISLWDLQFAWLIAQPGKCCRKMFNSFLINLFPFTFPWFSFFLSCNNFAWVALTFSHLSQFDFCLLFRIFFYSSLIYAMALHFGCLVSFPSVICQFLFSFFFRALFIYCILLALLQTRCGMFRQRRILIEFFMCSFIIYNVEEFACTLGLMEKLADFIQALTTATINWPGEGSLV